MESAGKIKKTSCAIGALVLFLFSCQTPPVEPVIIIHDPLVLQEITPLPRAVVARQAVSEFEPVYSTFRIAEVSEVNGVQRFFLVRMGADRTGIQIGTAGEIAEDEAFQRIIGNYRIIELYADFFRSEIIDLTHRIGVTAFARVQIGEKVKETAP